MIIVNNKLIVADTWDDRVLIWNSIPTSNDVPADVVIGQPDMYTDNNVNPPNASTLSSPTDVASDGTKLIVADSGNRRVLVYNTIPTTNNAAADVVIGQPDMFTISDTYPLTKYIINDPRGVYYDSNSGKLFVTIHDDLRVLIYNSIPTSDGAGADLVVGQSSFSSQNVGNAANEFHGPITAKVLNYKLVVADSLNGRVSIFNSIPSANNASADTVIGKSDFNINPTSEQGPTQQYLTQPYDTDWDGHNFFVLDSNDNRILLWNTFPAQNGASASAEIGYNTFTDNSAALDPPTASSLDSPYAIAHYNNYLFVSDSFNNRILRFTDTTTYPDLNITSASISGLLTSNILQAQTLTDSPNIYVSQNLTVQVATGSASSQVVLPQGTTITTTSGDNLDPSNLQISVPSLTQLTNIGANIQGDLQWGIPDVGLQFSQPITLSIFVGTDYNGQTFSIVRSVSGTSNWTSDGIVSPSTCKVTNGYCQFQATKASYYVVIPYTNASVSNSNSTSVPDPNFPSNYKYSIQAGPYFISDTGLSVVSSENDASGTKVMLAKNVSTNDIHLFIDYNTPQDLLRNNIIFPWQQGYNTAGEIYHMQLLSAFNGYPIPKLDNPATVIISYNPSKLYGLDPRKLRIAYYDTFLNKWKLLQNNTVFDTFNHTLANTTNQFSYFAVVYPR